MEKTIFITNCKNFPYDNSIWPPVKKKKKLVRTIAKNILLCQFTELILFVDDDDNDDGYHFRYRYYYWNNDDDDDDDDSFSFTVVL